MDSFEVNKIAGAVLAALLVVVASNVFLGQTATAPTEHADTGKNGAASANPGYDLMPPEEQTAATPASTPQGNKAATSGGGATQILAMIAAANSTKGKKVFKKCKSCHTTSKGGKNKIGPNLWNVLGRNKATYAGFKYSTAMKSKGGAWSYQDIAAFLRKPKAFITGTKMTFTGISKVTDLANLMAYLRTLSDNPLPPPR